MTDEVDEECGAVPQRAQHREHEQCRVGGAIQPEQRPAEHVHAQHIGGESAASETMPIAITRPKQAGFSSANVFARGDAAGIAFMRALPLS